MGRMMRPALLASVAESFLVPWGGRNLALDLRYDRFFLPCSFIELPLRLTWFGTGQIGRVRHYRNWGPFVLATASLLEGTVQ